CNGYDVIVTGIDKKPEVFTDFSQHPFVNRPSKLVNDKGLKSNAAGRYQFMARYWLSYKQSLNLPDFGPESQDKWAIQLIRECGALGLIQAGRFADAIQMCRSRWASLPGAGYGQRENPLAALQAVYVRAGGVVA
ncbi:MAG TPA: glycoside hydrolase family 104 protein, partial [Alphaproteobacteria bacterium]|nr:glycoside hydrolase family 104 protein [Alphaproteobacteria bacterium]